MSDCQHNACKSESQPVNVNRADYLSAHGEECRCERPAYRREYRSYLTVNRIQTIIPFDYSFTRLGIYDIELLLSIAGDQINTYMLSRLIYRKEPARPFDF